MTTKSKWTDADRENLRETIRNEVLGRLRLAKSDHEDILDGCAEVYIKEEAPKKEQQAFVTYASEQLARIAQQLAAEQATWPPVTDSDRLDQVEADLRDRGILLWQASPCCDTCTGSELPDRLDVIEAGHPGFRQRVRGYAFYIDQTLAEMLAESSELTVYLAYGWFSEDGSNVEPDVYEKNALGIAEEICQCLRARGFEPDWDGDFSKKIGVSLNWQRRAMLV
jgi:hypothetical protein